MYRRGDPFEEWCVSLVVEGFLKHFIDQIDDRKVVGSGEQVIIALFNFNRDGEMKTMVVICIIMLSNACSLRASEYAPRYQQAYTDNLYAVGVYGFRPYWRAPGYTPAIAARPGGMP